MPEHENNDEFTIVEENKELEPFTLDDALDDETNTDVCLLCLVKETCPIAIYVNKLSMKRDGYLAEDVFGCSLFSSIDEDSE